MSEHCLVWELNPLTGKHELFSRHVVQVDAALTAGTLVDLPHGGLGPPKLAWLITDEDDNEAFWETLNTGVLYKRSDQ